MPPRHPALPLVWLVSDARNDAALDAALRRLPRGSGLIFRHYRLPHAERRKRFIAVRRIARTRAHCVVLAGSAGQARRWGADGAYGDARTTGAGPAMLRLVTAHSLHEIGQAGRARAAAILLSPVFATRSHRGAATLGPMRFRLVAARSRVPVIALGGMTRRNAAHLRWQRWAAIDGLS